MEAAKIFFSIVFVIDLVAIIVAFAKGDFFKDGAALLKNPWGAFTMVDIYATFFLFIGWVWYRENGWGFRILYALLTCTLGSLFCLGYVLVLLFTSNDDWNAFWLGVGKTALLD